MKTAAIVGAGVIGVSCARALQTAGWQVTLFDPAPPGSGVSAGNAGQIAIDHVRPLARPDVLRSVPRMLVTPLGPLTLRLRGIPALSPWLARFAGASRPTPFARGTAALASLLATAVQDWRSAVRSAGIPDMLRQNGALCVIETPAGLDAARTEARMLRAHDVEFRDVSPAELAEQLPGLAVPIAGGRLFPRAAHVLHPHRLVQRLAERFIADGGELLATPVTAIRDGAVTTQEGERPADAIILAAGLASARLARPLGLHLPITAERGYHAMLPDGALPVRLPTTFNERGFVMTPMEHGLRLAGTVELGAGGRAPDWARADILCEHARRLFGTEITATERWHGDRPTLPDYLPAIGRVPGTRTVVVAAAHQHLGLTLAAVTARLVAGMLDGVAAPVDLRPFAPGRFERQRA